MIKSIIGLLVLFLPLQTYAQVVNFKDIDSVFVKKTDWNINELRDPPLTCTTFEEYGTKEGYIINKEHNIKEIKQLCKELRNMPTSKPKVMDVRCKLYFTHQTLLHLQPALIITQPYWTAVIIKPHRAYGRQSTK